MFPILYKNNRFFKIYFKDNYYWTEYGKIGGKILKSNKKKSTLKKVTTFFNNKILSGYTKNKQKLTFQPMLSYSYNKMKHHLIFPAYIQPKLDGFRAIYHNKHLYSKTNKKFNHVDKLISKINISKNIYLDGELVTDNINNLKALFSKNKPNIKNLKYYVFDMYDKNNPDLTFEQRLKILKKIKNINLVKTNIVNNNKQINNYLNIYLKNNYEGFVLKNKKGIYKFGKNFNVLTTKQFKTNKFKIVGFKKDLNNGIIFILKCLNSNKTFKSTVIGSHNKRKELYNNRNKYLNKYVKVKYLDINNGCVTRNPIVIFP